MRHDSGGESLNKVLSEIKESDTWLSLGEKIVTWGPPLLGLSGTSAISAWAAKTTTWLSSLGPIAWVGAGIVGGLSFLVGYRLWVASATGLQRIRLAKKFEVEKSPINPLDDTFTRLRIPLSAFEKPIPEAIQNKTFVDCEIYGPGVIAFLGTSHIANNGFFYCDLVKIRPDIFVRNVIAFNNVTMRNCKLYKITLLVPPALTNQFPEGDQWITDL